MATESKTQEPIATFGKSLLAEFPQDSSYRNLNHGSFGTFPLVIRDKLREFQDMAEARPDPFIRYDIKNHLTASREAVAKLLNAPLDTVVFCSNATTAINIVLRNLEWDSDCKDEILYFETIYGACGKTIDFVVDFSYGRASSRGIPIRYPCETEEIVACFQEAVKASRAAGKRPKMCVFDVVTSLPGVRFPFEALAAACKETGLMSLVDGAQGIGMVDIDLGALDADFFLSNCHKWLHVPRGCCVLQVAFRNQHLMRSTVPTSHGYEPRTGARYNPLPTSEQSPFITNFSYVGTIDTSPFLCVKHSIEWRQQVLGGEERIRTYQRSLAENGGQRVADILGTEILQNKAGSLTDCAMINVALPLWVGKAEDAPAGAAVLTAQEATVAITWMTNKIMSDYKTWLPLYMHADRVWVRISAQVYLDMEDLEFAGTALKELCEQVAKGGHKAET
ncbi:putative aminotransferase [Ceratocystis platani]|uniref:Putative aminotransferase n=1 Tax=Ceratocystis fimbriata f. sp. platani TaxID=88771 RepID=A0A0F8B435_CERFI|nr:putative aminotransferase [Ceratocystis platani]